MIMRSFGVQKRAFCLKVAQWRDLEKARDCGLGMIAARLAPLVALKSGAARGVNIMNAISAGHLGEARLDDVREPILRGLIGGGLSSTEAGDLVSNVFDEGVDAGRGPLFEWAPLAFEIVTNAIIGLEDERPGEIKAAAQKKPRVRRSKTGKPASSNSMAL